MADQQQSQAPAVPTSPAQPSLTRVAERASTFLNDEGVEVFIDEDEEGYAVPEPIVESDDDDIKPAEKKDDDLIDLPSLDDEPEIKPELPDPEEKPLELDAKFAAYFEKATGMPMEDFGATLHEIRTIVKEIGADGLKNGIQFIKASQQAQQIESVRSEVDKLWGVPREESLKRLEQIKPYFDRMSKEKQNLYDTPEGADLIWRSIEAKAPSTKTQTSKSGKNPAGRRYVYTQQQLDAMSKDEYAANADKITEAYQKGLVEY